MTGRGAVGRGATSKTQDRGRPSVWRLIKRGASAATVSSLGLALLLGSGPLPARAAAEMDFAVTQLGSDPGGICGRGCVEVISAKGEINGDTADQFIAFLSNHLQEQNLRPMVLLDSPGGTVVGAMKLGTVFRKIGASVVVGEAMRVPGTDEMGLTTGLCMSACVYAFFGGKQRVVPPISRLGIHRMVINESARDPAGGSAMQQTFGSDDIVAMLSSYARSMGVDPNVITQAERIAPESIHILTQREIARWRLARSRL